MSVVYGTYGPQLNAIPRIVKRVVGAVYSRVGSSYGFHRASSRYAIEKGVEFRRKLLAGETIYLLGIGPEGHNTGVAAISVSRQDGVRILANNEEERFSGIKHTNQFPVLAIDETKKQLDALGVEAAQVHAVLASWDYIGCLAFDLKTIFEHAPKSLALLDPKYHPTFNLMHLVKGLSAPRRLSTQMAWPEMKPFIGMHHHGNHAYMSYAISPFRGDSEPVMVAVLDGTGDNGAITLYVVTSGEWRCLRENQSTMDSLGYLYGYISSTQGGWSFLSSEGRYMGAAAWGNHDRITNPYYKRLRQIIYFGKDGQVHINRRMANWHLKSRLQPYGPELTEILGPPIPHEKMWNPDCVLNVTDVIHSEITQDRVDKAAALQLVFEDALTHIVEYLIRKTRSNKLVLTGGAALNCIANMRMLHSFDSGFYRRYIGRDCHLNLWVPPIPNDAGAALGAAFQFAMRNGASGQSDFGDPYLCGSAPSFDEILQAVTSCYDVCHRELGNVHDTGGVAALMAEVVAADGVLGIFQGRAETGPRALGNRSILANPCNPHTLDIINARVKYRERVRPLAPMVTLEEAQRMFALDEGAAAHSYDAYNYMVLTVRAKSIAKELIPAVVHHDGTSRIQIVRRHLNPLIYSFLKQMGRAVGVEASVNTSLNVGSPIVQSPTQAIDALTRAKGMDGLIMVGACGRAVAVWTKQMAHVSKLPGFIDRRFSDRQVEPMEVS